MNAIEWTKKLAFARKYFAVNLPANESARMILAELQKIHEELLLINPESVTEADSKKLELLLSQIYNLQPKMFNQGFLKHQLYLFKTMASKWKKRYWLGFKNSKHRQTLQDIQSLRADASLFHLYHVWRKACALHVELQYEGIRRKAFNNFRGYWFLIILLNIALLFSPLFFFDTPSQYYSLWISIFYLLTPFCIMNHYRLKAIDSESFLFQYAISFTCWSLIFLPAYLISLSISAIPLSEYNPDFAAKLTDTYSRLGICFLSSLIGWATLFFFLPRKLRFKLFILILLLITMLCLANYLLADILSPFKLLYEQFYYFPLPKEKAYPLDDIVRFSAALHIFGILPLLLISAITLLILKLLAHRRLFILFILLLIAITFTSHFQSIIIMPLLIFLPFILFPSRRTLPSFFHISNSYL